MTKEANFGRENVTGNVSPEFVSMFTPDLIGRLRNIESEKLARIEAIAHRGGQHLMPANTFAAFDNTVAMGVCGIELDVHLTSDGIPIIIHGGKNNNYALTTDYAMLFPDGNGSISGHTFEESQRLNANYGMDLVTPHYPEYTILQNTLRSNLRP